MDTASSQPGDLVLPIRSAAQLEDLTPTADLIPAIAKELWTTAEAETCDLTIEEFAATLTTVGTKLITVSLQAQRPATPKKSLSSGPSASPNSRWPTPALSVAKLHGSAFSTSIALHSPRQQSPSPAPPLLATISPTPSTPNSTAFANSTASAALPWPPILAAARSSAGFAPPSRSATSTTIAAPTAKPRSTPSMFQPPAVFTAPIPIELKHLTQAVARTFQNLPPEDRFLLSSYFLDRQTLLSVARIINVHEATISRRLKRLVANLRKQLLQNLQSGGLSKRAAEEALGTDPRDIEINLRTLLQTSQTDPFSYKTTAAPEQP